MSAEDKLLLAVGLFDSGQGLACAVEELVDAGVASARINLLSATVPTSRIEIPDLRKQIACAGESLASSARAFATAAGTAQATYDMALDLLAATARSLVPAQQPATAPSPPDFASHSIHAGHRVASRETGRSTLDRQAERLGRHLDSGGSVLVIAIDSPEEQQRVCTTLLTHSDHDVQTHELRLAN